MLKRLTHVQVWVHDQGAALAFYTGKLGMQLRDDVSPPEFGGFRWLTVGLPEQPDVAIVLLAVPGPPGLDADTANQLKSLVAKGVAGSLFISTDDCQATYDELTRRGVEFHQEPTKRPYGMDAAFRDPSGNEIRIMQGR
jgi:catechol 2,3-dioxygenase-like lactoylglutathione lyase family enzyme